ncbi:DUF5602 domain-containing protein [Rubrivirga marina]|uniref:TTHB210-like domain-containing protein n=1 Tax=Rubrivirga marina TaxID=1196024 RepID=A0A271J2I9_9BACT|nr:DUF5602 domain-containing protein [Rubrivirga marina]PAP77264.1 hypothetical protein BSZ37_12880 [Rubrivirga marina]
MTLRTLLFAALAGGLLAALAAVAGLAPQDHTLYGDPVSIGDGSARTYVTLDADGAPTAIGVLLTGDALSGLPAHPGGPGHEMDHMHVLPVPAAAREAGLVTDHVSLDWNANGHEPEGLFTRPHFDVHFYTVPADERTTWMPGSPGFADGARTPDTRYVPAGYLADPTGTVVPAMGLHWLDGADPTYAPGGPGFSEVVLYGSYGGRMIFVEPMITRAFFESLRASGVVHEEALAQPAAWAAAGYYPTTYSVRYDVEADAFRVEVGGMVYRQAS